MAISCSASIRLGSARIQNHRLRSASWRSARSTTCAMFLLLSARLEGRTAPPSTSRHPTSDCSPFRPKTAHDLLGSTDGRLNRDAILRPDGHQLMSIPTFERGEGVTNHPCRKQIANRCSQPKQPGGASDLARACSTNQNRPFAGARVHRVTLSLGPPSCHLRWLQLTCENYVLRGWVSGVVQAAVSRDTKSLISII